MCCVCGFLLLVRPRLCIQSSPPVHSTPLPPIHHPSIHSSNHPSSSLLSALRSGLAAHTTKLSSSWTQIDNDNVTSATKAGRYRVTVHRLVDPAMEGYNAYRSRAPLNLDLVRQANQAHARGYVLLLHYHLAVLFKHAAHQQQVCNRDNPSRHSSETKSRLMPHT